MRPRLFLLFVVAAGSTSSAVAVAGAREPAGAAARIPAISRLLDRFGSSDLALAAYNAGPTAVARAGGAPNGATLEYVANVTGLWRRLHGCG